MDNLNNNAVNMQNNQQPQVNPQQTPVGAQNNTKMKAMGAPKGTNNASKLMIGLIIVILIPLFGAIGYLVYDRYIAEEDAQGTTVEPNNEGLGNDSSPFLSDAFARLNLEDNFVRVTIKSSDGDNVNIENEPNGTLYGYGNYRDSEFEMYVIPGDGFYIQDGGEWLKFADLSSTTDLASIYEEVDDYGVVNVSEEIESLQELSYVYDSSKQCPVNTSETCQVYTFQMNDGTSGEIWFSDASGELVRVVENSPDGTVYTSDYEFIEGETIEVPTEDLSGASDFSDLFNALTDESALDSLSN